VDFAVETAVASSANVVRGEATLTVEFQLALNGTSIGFGPYET